MQEESPFASKRRVGCVMWLAIAAIILSTISLFSSITQEMAWDRRVQEFSALVASASGSSIPDAPVESSSQEQSPTPVAVVVEPSSPPTSIPAVASGVTYEQICGVDESNMTDPQLQAHADRFEGQTFSGWNGWVYDVVSQSDDTYDLEIATQERGLFWSRDIIVREIPTDLALRLNVEQPIRFDGRIAEVEYSFEVMCNPLTVSDFALR